MATGKQHAIPNFRERLRACDLTTAKASRLTGITRRTLTKLVNGDEVRQKTLQNFLERLAEQIGEESVLAHFSDVSDAIFEGSNIVSLDNTKFFPRAELSTANKLGEITDLLDEATQGLVEVTHDVKSKSDVLAGLELIDIEEAHEGLSMKLKHLKKRVEIALRAKLDG